MLNGCKVSAPSSICQKRNKEMRKEKSDLKLNQDTEQRLIANKT